VKHFNLHNNYDVTKYLQISVMVHFESEKNTMKKADEQADLWARLLIAQGFPHHLYQRLVSFLKNQGAFLPQMKKYIKQTGVEASIQSQHPLEESHSLTQTKRCSQALEQQQHEGKQPLD
jgi:hypothetical protein